jgi:hypothetical protein
MVLAFLGGRPRALGSDCGLVHGGVQRGLGLLRTLMDDDAGDLAATPICLGPAPAL